MHTETEMRKGSDEHLLEYKKRKDKKKILRTLVLPMTLSVLLLILLFLILRYAFVVKTVEFQGETGYTAEELFLKCGIAIGDNMFSVSGKDAEVRLKEAFPYIKSVSLEKEFPSKLTLYVLEEYTTFSYHSQGEYFLFNYDLRLMDKFDSYESLSSVRDAIIVEMPEPKNYIVPQYIQMREEDRYVAEVIATLSESPLVDLVNAVDLTDRFVLRMNCGKNVSVELGDFTNLEDKFSALFRLLGEDGAKMSGNVDLSCYPRCFYALSGEDNT